MAHDLQGKYFVFAIDTNKYAGNFERAMAWYITGFEPEYMHGGAEWIGELAEKELALLKDSEGRHPFDDVTMTIAMDPCPNYVSMIPSPGKTINYNSVGIFMDHVPEAATLKLMKERAKGFTKLKPPKGDLGLGHETNLRILGFRLLKAELMVTRLEMP